MNNMNIDNETNGFDTYGTNRLAEAVGNGMSLHQPAMQASKYPLMAFRLTADMQKQIETAAKEDGVSKSVVIKSALEAYMLKRNSNRTFMQCAQRGKKILTLFQDLGSKLD